MKLSSYCPLVGGRSVAPFAGAWIETRWLQQIYLIHVHVAPFAGAWIETTIGDTE